MELMVAQFSIPNDYTACEEYRGCIIGIRNARYSVFEQSSLNPETGASWPESYDTRQQARASIDHAIKVHHFPAGEAA
jgi:hypothetical protein